jgi:hypothetical protein
MKAAGFGHRGTLRGEAFDRCRQCVVSGLVGVEVDGHARVAGDGLAHVAPFFQRSRERYGSRVEGCVEARAQLREERGVT